LNEGSPDSTIKATPAKVCLGTFGLATVLFFQSATFTNPIVPAPAADPWVTFKDGFYYYCRTSPGTPGIIVGKSRDLTRIGDQDTWRTVYRPPSDTAYSREIWAPELHFLGNRWFVYFAADDGKNENHRMYVLESEGTDPQGSYLFRGKITDSTDKWAIDGTVLDLGFRGMFFIWSGWEGDTNVRQNLYIAPMSDPVTICGPRVMISTPTEPWETVGRPHVNEGPEILRRGDAIHIVYSASGSWTQDYCLGLLTCIDGQVMRPESWKKQGPVFSKGPEACGVGHASFTRSPDGTEDWIVYHAMHRPDGGWGNRSVRAQRFTWKGLYPDFGRPVVPGTALPRPSGTPAWERRRPAGTGAAGILPASAITIHQ